MCCLSFSDAFGLGWNGGLFFAFRELSLSSFLDVFFEFDEVLVAFVFLYCLAYV